MSAMCDVFGQNVSWLDDDFLSPVETPFDLLLGTAPELRASPLLGEKAPQDVPTGHQRAPVRQAAQPFPSMLFEAHQLPQSTPLFSTAPKASGQQHNNEYGGSFQLPSPTASSRPSFPPDAQHVQQQSTQQIPDPLGSQLELGGMTWRHDDPELQEEGEALNKAEAPQNLSPAKSHTGESGLFDLASMDSTGCDGGDSVGDLNGSSQLPKLGSGEMSRSLSWQRGINKRNKIRPRQRAQGAQVAVLKERVAELTEKCSSMERALNEQSPPKGANTLGEPGLTAGPQAWAGVPQGTRHGQQSEKDPMSVAKIGVREFTNLYKTRVSSVAVKLGSLPRDDNERAVEELRQAACEVVILVMRCCMENSTVAKTWMMESFETEQARLKSEGRSASDFWPSTAASLELTAQQREATLHLRGAFLERLTALKALRESIGQGLTGSSPSSFRNRITAAASLGAMQQIEAYVSNIKDCDRLICDFVSSMLTQILSPVQMARCIVAAYPHWPDMLALSTCIAASQGEASAICMLNQELHNVTIKR